MNGDFFSCQTLGPPHFRGQARALLMHEQFTCSLAHRYLLRLASLRFNDVDKAPLKIEVIPFQFENLAAAHRGEQGNLHHGGCCFQSGGVQDRQKPLSLIGVKVFCFLMLSTFASSILKGREAHTPCFTPKLIIHLSSSNIFLAVCVDRFFSKLILTLSLSSLTNFFGSFRENGLSRYSAQRLRSVLVAYPPGRCFWYSSHNLPIVHLEASSAFSWRFS